MAQFPQHRISNSDDIRTGNAVSPNRARLGVPSNGAEGQSVIALSLGAPATAVANGLSVSATITGAGAAAVLGGSLTSGGVGTFDVPRNVVGAWTNTAVVTVTGTDVYGQTMIEQSASGTSLAGLKAFKTITSITTSATITGATFGSGDVFGLPYRPVPGGFVRGRLGEDTADAGTYVAPIRTTSTATSADVRGTYDPAGAVNGSNVFTVLIAVQNGPNDSDAYGIAQYAG